MDPWNQAYLDRRTPWDTGEPDPLLLDAIEEGLLPDGRVLELGCGTGTNARTLAECGWEVVAVDRSPAALALAQQQFGLVRYVQADLLDGTPLGDDMDGPYDAVFDRGFFHTFDDPADRDTIARRIAAFLKPGGVWMTLVGSAESGPLEVGMPQRTLAETVAAIEPHLALRSVRASSFAAHPGAVAWMLFATRRPDQISAPTPPPTLVDPAPTS